MFIVNLVKHKFINNNKNNMQNKSKIIDYLILLNLLMNKLNIYFPYNFYKEILLYLIPNIDIKINFIKDNFYNMYYDYCDYNYFMTKYNIKHYLLHYLNNNNYKNKNIYTKTIIFNNNHNDIETIDINIYFINKFIIFNNIIHLFQFRIPVIMNIMIKYINKYDIFNNFIIMIWEDNKGLLMDDYIYSSPIKKIIYFELIKKVVKRLLN